MRDDVNDCVRTVFDSMFGNIVAAVDCFVSCASLDVSVDRVESTGIVEMDPNM